MPERSNENGKYMKIDLKIELAYLHAAKCCDICSGSRSGVTGRKKIISIRVPLTVIFLCLCKAGEKTTLVLPRPLEPVLKA